MRAIVLAAGLVFLAGAAAEAQPAGAAAPRVRVRLRDQPTVQGFLRGNSKDEYEKSVISQRARDLLRRYDFKVEHYEVRETVRP